MSCGKKVEFLSQPWRGDLTSCAKLTESAIDPNTTDTPDNYVKNAGGLMQFHRFGWVFKDFLHGYSRMDNEVMKSV